VVGEQDCGTLNTSTGVFTVNEDGDYLISAGASVIDANESVLFAISAGSASYTIASQNPTTDSNFRGTPVQVPLTAGQTISAWVQSSSDTNYNIQQTSVTRLIITKLPSKSEQVARVGQGADLLGTYVDSADDVCPAGSI